MKIIVLDNFKYNEKILKSILTKTTVNILLLLN